MVIGPCDLKNLKENNKYDILFVDESHRLSRRKNLNNYEAFDNTCKDLGMDRITSTQLDWVLKQGKYNVLFYDEDQSVKGSDITHDQFQNALEKSGKTEYTPCSGTG